MNWLGKVFVVVILIMSLVFMGLSMAVYATHKNWKTVSEGLAKEVTQLKAEKEAETSAHNRRVEDLEREVTAEKQQAVKAEAERVSLAEHNVQIQTELDGLKQNQRDHIAAVASTQAINQTLAGEVGDLRQKIRGEQQTRDRVFKRALDATEELNQAAGEYQNARERSDQLTKQVAGMTTVMREKGIDPATNPNAVVPTVEGVVSGTKRAGGAQLIEVTIGSDDGLKTGNTLEVSRGDKYLGRLEVIQTSPDKSVGRVDRNFQQGQIQEGDRVATRIKL
jgi:LPS O-antigen subunit length determinant protein (WzzB/FepE family)